MRGGIKKKKNTLVKTIYQTIAVINGWDQWDLPAVLIKFIPRRLAAIRLVKGGPTKY